jgi:ribosomal protein L37E
MMLNEFQRPVSVDYASRGSQCEWCGKPAEQRLTAIGGAHHNESGAFCRSCGEQFTQTVANSLQTPTNQPAYLH